MLSVYGFTRKTDYFLSIGTGITANGNLLWLNNRLPAYRSLASAATNSEITHILFRTLLTAFAPNNGDGKYRCCNVEGRIEGKDDYEGVGSLDDVKALPMLLDRAKTYCDSNRDVIRECADVISRCAQVHG